MSFLPEMEWSGKWDLENLVSFGSKASESPKKLQLADWMIVDDGEIDTGSFNLSGSDGGHGSSAKSSISASTDSSTKDAPNFRFMSFEGSENFSKKMGMKGTVVSGNSNSPTLEASVGSMEPLIGLKLGKRTYFENGGAGGNVKSTPFSVVPTPTTQKKTKSSAQNAPIPICQVEGCNIDLSPAKEYHRKHRVCDAHSKCPKVIIGGLERRFCQQCSRFHSLSEFDDKKRSCRRRLSDHNARRRKPQQETVHFNSTRLLSPFYGGREQMNFLLNNVPLIHSRTPANSTWENTCNSKFTLTKEYPVKSTGHGGTDEKLHISGIELPHAINMHGNVVDGLLASKSSAPEVLSPGPGCKGSMTSSHLDAAPEYRRALSLLSNNSWVSSGPETTPVQHSMHENVPSLTQPMMHVIPDGVPLSCTDFWHSTHARVPSLGGTNGNFQEMPLFKTPYEADFYSNMLN